MLPAHLLDTLTGLLGRADVLTDPVACYAYAYDNSRHYLPPEAVVFATSTEQVARIVKLCNEYHLPLTVRGRGTGTAGGSIPERGGLVLSLERMRRIVRVDPANRVLVAEPGVLNAEVQQAAGAHGFFWPPDPSSSAFCSIGGNLGTSAGGPHAVKYGTTRDHVLGLQAVTGRGDLIRTGCYTTKGVVGYDLTRLLIGSEGTLAIITEATLKLTPKPAGTGGLTAHYRSIEDCARAITAIMAQPHTPSALEFLDSASLDLLRRFKPGLLPDHSRAMLMIEIDGTPAERQVAAAAILAAALSPGLVDVAVVAEPQALWAARKALSPLLREIAPKKINEDIVVPVSHLPDLLHGVAAITARYGIANANFGHAGNGNIHVNLLIDPDDPQQVTHAARALDEIFDLVLSLHGTLSGEHGVGREKRPYIDREIDPATLQLMRAIKQVFDPGNILNPGKLFP